ncbi:monooxygenase [Polyangium jinanense]|uniref:Monooxygenase n=1 Tax=Polyangium jinanense TaxID=2829994 RepID=A0A9X4AQQ7_9BACT|nr:monooxygenase [Polyangium jinanense]MDC3954892.1 monooxygenase [Polyangium jinanense]MDC3981338.1 monooxygenase [Polyangium jinanense]
MLAFDGVRIACVLVALGALAGCTNGGSSGGPGTPAAGALTYHRDIKPLVDTKCGKCHAEGGVGPFALTTYEEVHAMRGAVEAAIVAKTMPPWPADNDCNEYLGNRSLTDEQIDTISRWIADGAPEGNPADAPVPVEDTAQTLSRVDLELPIPEAYTPKVSPDDYHCFFVDWPAEETTYITGMGVEPGERSIVHHVIAFVAKPDNLADFQALDDAEPGVGWTCYGGPGGGPSSAGWVGAWVPGSTGADYPAGTGIEIPPGSKLIVQMHYNTSAAAAVPDQTKLLVRTDKTVEKKAAIMPFTKISWVTQQTMTIPAHTSDVMHEVMADPSPYLNIATGGALPSNTPVNIYTGGVHMHTRGKSGSLRVVRGDAEECLVDIPSWNFHWQGSYALKAPTRFEPGDQLHLKCTWDNTEMYDINWGEGTNDEMCLGTVYVSE